MTVDPEIEAKRRKAEKYATEPERFEVLDLKLRMNSTHDTRTIEFVNGSWKCTCDFYQLKNTCSHIMAAQMIFQTMLSGTRKEHDEHI